MGGLGEGWSSFRRSGEVSIVRGIVSHRCENCEWKSFPGLLPYRHNKA